MITKKFQKAIDRIAKSNILGNWFFIGSVGSELEGMPFLRGHSDMDIAVDKEALQKFRKLFGQKGKRQGDSVFFDVDGVQVELCLKPKGYGFFKRIKVKNGLNTISLRDQAERNEHAGSLEKALRIKRFLEKQGF